jgi:hypothetical protein
MTHLVVIGANAFGDHLGRGPECRREHFAVDIRDDHLGRLFQSINLIRGSDVSRVYIWESAMSWHVTYLVIVETDAFSENLGRGAVCVGQYSVGNGAGAAGRDGS